MQKLKRVVIKEELVALTGKVNHAIVLNQMIYWSERVKDSDKFIEEELEKQRRNIDGSQESEEDIKSYLKNGWIYKTADEMAEECMNIISRQTINRIFNDLVDNGWLDKRRNPKYKWDKTWQYRVNLTKIQKDLQSIGYSLEGYSLLNNPETNDNSEDDQPNAQNEQPNAQNEQSSSQNEQSKAHYEQTIPEITTEITSKITTDNQSINEARKNNNGIEQQPKKEEPIDRLTDLNNNKKEKTKEQKILELQNIISDKKELPIPVAKPMMMYTERLIDDEIDIEDIISTYYANKEVINEYQFGNILSNVLYGTKGKIRNIRGLLHTAIKNYFKDINEVEHLKESKPKEIVPDWFKERKNEIKEPQDIAYNLASARNRFSDIFNF